MIFVKLIGYVVAILSIFVVLFLASGCISSHDNSGNNVKPVEKNALDPAIHQQIKDVLNASGYQSHVTTDFLAPRIHDVTDFGIEATKGPIKITGTATSVDQVKEAVGNAQALEDRNFTNINVVIPGMEMTFATTDPQITVRGTATSIGQVDGALNFAKSLQDRNLTVIEIDVPSMAFKAAEPQVLIESAKATSIERIDEAMETIRTLRNQNVTGIVINASSLSFAARLGNTAVNSTGANECALSAAFCDDLPANGNAHWEPAYSGGKSYEVVMMYDQDSGIPDPLQRQAQLIKQKLAGKVDATVALKGAYLVLDSGKREQTISEAEQMHVNAIKVTYCTKITTVKFPISEISKNRAEYNADLAANNIDFQF